MSYSIKFDLEQKGIIAICRKVYGDDLLHLAEALHMGGIGFIEVTFDQASPHCNDQTAEAIRMLHNRFPQICVGAGTVLHPAQVDVAKQAGAKYMISPNTDVEVIRHTKEAGLISIPGAMTPTEIMTAHHAGADYVKLFPCAYLGERYIKDILSPISHVKLIATGGIKAENLLSYLKLGMVGAGISGALTNRKTIDAGDWQKITADAKILTEIVSAHLGGLA